MAGLKKSEEVVEILEAFDLTGSLRGAAALAGCDHKTVAHWVAARDAAGGGLPVAGRRRPMVDGFGEKIDELVDRSGGRIRADRAHEKFVATGYLGSERTTRRAVAAAKRGWRVEHGRRTMPWVAEPGLWMQWDWLGWRRGRHPGHRATHCIAVGASPLDAASRRTRGSRSAPVRALLRTRLSSGRRADRPPPLPDGSERRPRGGSALVVRAHRGSGSVRRILVAKAIVPGCAAQA